MMDLILLTVVSALLCIMLPGASNGGLRKVFRFIAGLLFLLAVFRPIADSAIAVSELPGRWMERIFPKEKELRAEEERANEWLLSFSAQNIEKGVDALLINRYALPEDTVSSTAEVEMGPDGMWILKRLVIRIDPSVWCDVEEIERYIRDILGCPCVVLQDKGQRGGEGGGENDERNVSGF